MASGTAMVIEGAADIRARTRLRCWGDFAVSDESTGADLRPRGRKARALLAYLALHPGKPVSRERLTGLLWGDRAEEQARASLRQAIFELKAFTSAPRKLLAVDRDHLTLDPAGLVTDIDALREGVAALDSIPEPDERLFADLDGLDSGFDDWLAIERARQRDELVALVAGAAKAAAEKGDVPRTRALVGRLGELEDDPSRLDALLADVRPRPSRPPVRTTPADTQRWRVAVLLALILAAAVIAVGGWQFQRSEPDSPIRIAVLPFDDLSDSDNAFFADGIAEEIMAQLARDPGLRVAGRTSSRQFKGQSADLERIGRKLNVAYVLEGSVRSAGDRVRVNVALVQASDGMRLWAETFDGTLDDIFSIQHRIGADVAGALGHEFTQATPRGRPTTSGAVYSLYLSARGLIRERNPRSMIAAGELLERALALDPGFAPAWSSLAQVKRWDGNLPGAEGRRGREAALAHARRALALAPDLAEAHGVLGMILGFEDPNGQRHIKRAAMLDPNNAEFQFWLGHVLANEPDYPAMTAAYRRAFSLDPLWNYALDYAVQTAWRMEHRDEAIRYVRRIEREGSRYDAHMARGLLATTGGDLSGAALEFGAARAATGDVGKQAVAIYHRGGLLFQLGLIDAARREWQSCKLFWAQEEKRPLGMPERHAAHIILKQGKLPTAAELANVDRSGDPAGANLTAAMAKQLIRAGRAGEVAALYDSRRGLLGLSAHRPHSRLDILLRNAPVIAAALRAVGRGAEADTLLRRSDAIIADALRRSGGRAPANFHADAAQTWALLGKHDAAIDGLERARRNGWINADFIAGDLVDDIADEPAFIGLRGDPRFEAIRARMNAHLARERRELEALSTI